MSVTPRSPEEYRQVIDELDAVEIEVIGLHGAVEPSEDTTIPYIPAPLEDETFGTVPSEKPGALRLMDLEPGLEVVVRDERAEGAIVGKEVVLSPPRLEEIKNVGTVVLVKAQAYHDDGNFSEPRMINVAIWGVAPNNDGLFNQKRWIEPFQGAN